MLTKTKILKTLQQKKGLLAKYGVKSIGLFGSYSRDLQKEDSDIDILVDFYSKEETYDNLLHIYDVLENLFSNKKIDIVTKRGLSKYLGNYILKETIYA
ncbi:MAG: nucleotidyltransferase family protein [Polaribacter sp.]